MITNKAECSLIYGSSGTTKTSQIGQLAEYIWDKSGKKTRLVTSDGGGYDVIKDYVEAGLIEVLVIGNTEEHPLEMWDRACQGYWLGTKEGKKVWTKDGLDKVGAYAFEGLTSYGDLALGHLRRVGARLSQDPNFTFKDGDATYYGSNMTYFGFSQDRIYDNVMKTHMLPVEKVLWTALEGKGEEDGTKVPIYGPAIAGKKSIGKAPQWFGDCLHMEMLVAESGEDKNKQLKLVTKPVMYLKPHADKLTKIAFPAKVRVASQFAAEVPEFLDPPSLKVLFELQDKFRKQGVERLREKMATKGSVAEVLTPAAG